MLGGESGCGKAIRDSPMSEVDGAERPKELEVFGLGFPWISINEQSLEELGPCVGGLTAAEWKAEKVGLDVRFVKTERLF